MREQRAPDARERETYGAAFGECTVSGADRPSPSSAASEQARKSGAMCVRVNVSGGEAEREESSHAKGACIRAPWERTLDS